MINLWKTLNAARTDTEMTNSPKEYPMDNLTKELAEILQEMRYFADMDEIPGGGMLLKVDAVLDRYVDACEAQNLK